MAATTDTSSAPKADSTMTTTTKMDKK
jgi:hypothetical protein